MAKLVTFTDTTVIRRIIQPTRCGVRVVFKLPTGHILSASGVTHVV